MCLYSIIGIQSFKGSFRRTCHLLVDGVDYPLSQNCGGHIDNVTLEAVGYLNADGEHASVKGYICPLGQICMVSNYSLYNFAHDTNMFHRRTTTIRRRTWRASMSSTTLHFRSSLCRPQTG